MWAIRIHLTSGTVSFQDLTYLEAEAMLEALGTALLANDPHCKVNGLLFASRTFCRALLEKMPGEPKKRSWLW
jgi:hypothetical protein